MENRADGKTHHHHPIKPYDFFHFNTIAIVSPLW